MQEIPLIIVHGDKDAQSLRDMLERPPNDGVGGPGESGHGRASGNDTKVLAGSKKGKKKMTKAHSKPFVGLLFGLVREGRDRDDLSCRQRLELGVRQDFFPIDARFSRVGRHAPADKNDSEDDDVPLAQEVFHVMG